MTRKKKKPTRPEPFAGITRVDCCDGCTASRCAISRRPYCAHPHKGGLNSTDCRDRAACGRIEQCGEILKTQSGALIA